MTNDIAIWSYEMSLQERTDDIREKVFQQAVMLFLEGCASQEGDLLVARCPQFAKCVEIGLFGHYHRPDAEPRPPANCLVNTQSELHEQIAVHASKIVATEMEALVGVQSHILNLIEEEALQRESGVDTADQWADLHGISFKPRAEDRYLWNIVYPFVSRHPEVVSSMGSSEIRDPIARITHAVSQTNRRYMASHFKNIVQDEELDEPEKASQLRSMLEDAEEQTRAQLWRKYARHGQRSIPAIVFLASDDGDFTNLAAKVDPKQLEFLRIRLKQHGEIQWQT